LGNVGIAARVASFVLPAARAFFLFPTEAIGYEEDGNIGNIIGTQPERTVASK
jgi:hypothetical protein